MEESPHLEYQWGGISSPGVFHLKRTNRKLCASLISNPYLSLQRFAPISYFTLITVSAAHFLRVCGRGQAGPALPWAQAQPAGDIKGCFLFSKPPAHGGIYFCNCRCKSAQRLSCLAKIAGVSANLQHFSTGDCLMLELMGMVFLF